jgi:hypothetical protein
VSTSIFSCHHPPGSVGSIDESARKFLPNERPIAEHLEAEGHHVVARREGSKYGKNGDAAVCGQVAEFKAMNPSKGGNDPHKRVVNSITSSEDQPTRVVIDARPVPTVRPEHVHSGVRHALNIETDKQAAGTLAGSPREQIRVIGRSYDVSYDKDRLQQVRQELARERQPQRSPTTQAQAVPEHRFRIDRPPSKEVNQNQAPPRRYDLASERGPEDPKRQKGPSK